MADDSEEIICPKVELLTEVETNILCSVAGCSRILPNTSSLRMHLVKTHNVITDLKDNKIFDRESTSVGKKSKKKTLYCCPVDACVRGRNSGRPFSRLAHVKQVGIETIAPNGNAWAFFNINSCYKYTIQSNVQFCKH